MTDAALMDAAGDALPLEFVDELVQPEKDGDWASVAQCEPFS